MTTTRRVKQRPIPPFIVVFLTVVGVAGFAGLIVGLLG
jgi:hypothetical protein